MTDNVAVTGVIIAAVFGLVGWVVNRILIEPLDRNTNALCAMAQEVQKLNNTHGQVLDRVDNCEDDIKKWVKPEEVADAISYLISDKGNSIRSSIIKVFGNY